MATLGCEQLGEHRGVPIVGCPRYASWGIHPHLTLKRRIELAIECGQVGARRPVNTSGVPAREPRDWNNSVRTDFSAAEGNAVPSGPDTTNLVFNELSAATSG